MKAADGNRYILNTISLNEAGMKIIVLNSYQDIILSTLKSITTIFLLVILCLIAALAGLFIFLRKFFTPLFSIVETMKIVQTGDLSVQVPLINDDEIGYLAKSFNRMFQNLNSVINRNTALVTQVYEMQYLHKSSQYEALCNQIKPHFIHNTLNTISLLIKCNEYEKAIDNSIGLLNVQRRLQIKFGTSSQIYLDSILGKGTTITVSIPLNGKEEKNYVQYSDCG